MNSIFLKPSDPLLKKVAKEIPHDQIDSRKTRQIIETMLNVAYDRQKNKKKPIMMGLAAPQIGIPKKIILVDIKTKGKEKVGDLKIYINPEIIWTSKAKGEWYEGCFSTGRVCGIVSRPTAIKIKALIITPGAYPNRVTGCDIEEVEEKHTGYIARIFQHEIDHLDGKVFVDHISDPDKLHWVEEKEFSLYRNKAAWKRWEKKCSFEKWDNIKNENKVY